MELGTAATTTSNQTRGSGDTGDSIVEQRLAALLDLNAERAYEKELFRSERDRIEAALMSRPIESKKVFAYFGLMIGSLPPFALVFNVIGSIAPTEGGPLLFLVLLTAAGIATGIAGYASGKYVPSALRRISKFSFPNRVALMSLTGFAWGAVSGAIGGLFLFIIGSVFAAIAGGFIGAVALPVLVALHTPLRHGDCVELKHFLPIAFGITLSLCALILGV
jgi:hypothetical protein